MEFHFWQNYTKHILPFCLTGQKFYFHWDVLERMGQARVDFEPFHHHITMLRMRRDHQIFYYTLHILDGSMLLGL